jgi:hypothetical protein
VSKHDKEENIMKQATWIIAGIAGMTLASCGAPVVKDGIGYGLTHGHYVGVVELTTENDTITTISFDEYYLPYNWAKVSAEQRNQYPDDTVTRTWKRSPAAANSVIDHYAKYVTIGDKLFTASILGESPNETIVYSSTNIPDFETWVATELNAIWYVEQVEADAFFLATSTGIEHPNLVRVDANSNVAMTKSASGYWSSGLGWAGNMDALETLLIGTKLTLDPIDFEINEDGYWASGDVVTGATLTDFADYIAVALRAYNNRVVATALTFQ